MNTVHIVTIKDREDVFTKTKEFWESYNWKVIPIYNENQHPCIARNKLLRNFYDSNDDWICIADDDLVLMTEKEFKELGSVKALVGEVDYPKLNYREFLKNNEQLFNNTDLPISFSPTRSVNLAGRWSMVRLAKQYNRWPDSQIFNNYWVFERFPKAAAIFFHQNIKKKFNKEFFQDESLDGLQDWSWAMDQIEAGFAVGQLTNIIYKEISKRTVLFKGKTVKESQDIRRNAYIATTEHMIEKHDGISIMKNGGVNMRKWLKRSWKPQRGWTTESPPRLMVRDY